jgi:hypothetical protein
VCQPSGGGGKRPLTPGRGRPHGGAILYFICPAGHVTWTGDVLTNYGTWVVPACPVCKRPAAQMSGGESRGNKR